MLDTSAVKINLTEMVMEIL